MLSTQIAQLELLGSLEKDVNLDISVWTELLQTVVLVHTTIEMLVLKSNIMFTKVEDLQDNAKQDLIGINALKQQQKNMKTMYEAKLQPSKTAMIAGPAF